ncbi:tetratricopeptide repeat protein [Acidobacteriota bacterium]
MNGTSFNPDICTFILLCAVFLLFAHGEPSLASPPEQYAVQINPQVKDALSQIQSSTKEGDFTRAEALAKDLLKIAETDFGPKSIETAKALDALVEALWRGGKFKDTESHALAERALNMKETLLGPDHPEVAESLSGFAHLLEEEGSGEKSRKLYERCLAIREKAFGAGSLEVALTLNSLAHLLRDLAEYTQAKPLLERSLAIHEKHVGPDHPDIAWCLNNLGGLHRFTGDYVTARKYYERALAMRKKVLGPDHPHYAFSLNDMAILKRDSGNIKEAVFLARKTATILENSLGPEHIYTAASLANLGDYCRLDGNYAEAKIHLERALSIFEKADAMETRFVVNCLTTLGELYVNQGNYEKAVHYYERAISSGEKSLGPEHPHQAFALQLLAMGLDLDGKGDEAKRYYAQALRIREKSLGPNNPDVAESLKSLANYFARTGEYTKAMDSALRGETISRDHANLTISTLPERQALLFAAVRTTSLDIALSLGLTHLQHDGSSVSRSWDALIRSRASILDEMAGRHSTVAEANRIVRQATMKSTAADETADRRRAVAEANRIVRLATEVRTASQKLANLIVRGPGRNTPEGYRRRLNEAQMTKEKAEHALAEVSVSFREKQTRANMGYEKVVSSLPAGSAMVAYARYNRYDFDPKIQAPEEGRKVQAPGGDKAATGQSLYQKPFKPVPSYLAIIMRAGRKAPDMVKLGTTADIDVLIEQWRDEVTHPAGSKLSDQQSEAEYRDIGTRLRRKIWDPLAANLGGVKQIFVVPDGKMHLVNFATFPEGKTSYLVEKEPLIHYLSSERDLVRTRSIAHLEGKGLLLMGNPAFDETIAASGAESRSQEIKKEKRTLLAGLKIFRGDLSSCGTFRSLHFEELPETAREVNEIAHIWKSKNTSGQDADITTLQDGNATETQFKTQSPGREVLHIATHGFFLGGVCKEAPGGTRGVSGLKTATETEQKPAGIENPLLLSGLALAGANQRHRAGENQDDGILTAEEIASLDLSGVSWAVLSACDTGVGEIKAGEGVFGLRRAFKMAGAKTLIMSLWSVEDQVTRQWMTGLYNARYVDRKDTAEAVRQASLDIIKSRREKGQSTHPFYWGAFVAAGDWR